VGRSVEKRRVKRLLSYCLILALAAPVAFAKSEPGLPCPTGFASLAPAKAAVAEELVPKIGISPAQFDDITDRLRKTLSGNLATVLRSEWKAKGSVQEANKYVRDLVNDFLTPETRALVTKGLRADSEGFIRTVAKRLFDLAEADKKLVAEGKAPVLKPADLLGVRDPAPPQGARDLTFTYYTRAVGDEAGGKHQIRVRNYLRLVSPEEMAIGTPVNTFGRDGAPLTITRADTPGTFHVTSGAGASEEKRTLTAAELKKEIGARPTLYAAPHGGKFKLEVKTRLKDSVSTEKYPLLGGQNLVQKLDVSLSLKQVAALFGPLPAERAAALTEARARLAKVQEEIIAGIESKEKKALALPAGGDRSKALAEAQAGRERVGAVMLMLNTAVDGDPNFLKLEGATLYSRSAFEIAVPDKMAGKPVKLQTTVDRDLGAFRGVYDEQGNFLDPVETYQRRPLLNPASEREQRHWELKIPQPLVAKEAGLKSGGDFLAGIDVEDGPTSPELRRSMEAFSFCNVTNRGKFVHICSQADVDDRKPADR
jgi:hypothetical protein